MAGACYAGPQGAFAWACRSAIYLARLRVGQTRWPWIESKTPRRFVKAGVFCLINRPFLPLLEAAMEAVSPVRR